MKTFLALLLLFPTMLLAQNSAAPQPGMPLWRVTLPGGSYEVALRSIVSVSIHEYTVDGAARVTEVNIDTSGNTLPRFYYLEAVGAKSPFGVGQSTMDKVQELVNEAGDRSGQSDLWKRVVKNYPTSTHAHTIEYRVDTKEELQKIYESAEKAFRLQRSTNYKVGEKSEE